MPRDYGDPYPSDTGDSAPASPTAGFSETNKKRIVPTTPILGQRHTDFNETMEIEQPYPQVRHGYTGTIIEYLGNYFYSVQLQNGRTIAARDEYIIPDFGFIENQTVTVFSDQRRNTWILVGQKYPISVPVIAVELKETLEPGKRAKAWPTYIDGNGWIVKISSEEITVIDPNYHNFGMGGDRLNCVYDFESQHAICIGQHGLIRLGKNTEAISIDDSGEVEFYNDETTASSVKVTAHLTWMHNDDNLPQGKEVICKFFPASGWRKWVIIGREC